ncbi:SDR family oxidoreductase [Emticicia sp. TH156]|uniref:SDR family oxidoreductase n=1 Tax=Emticicia sp. TH156 TaxID=2067454 RepID=UPI000C76411D|nr:SDR family oxidoreductase [Emticicia sp. TH156]PLK44377.1 NAD(P)-dependent oxidoreductase [Emticicia sp. TH156]
MILVTGATGQFGATTIDFLLKKGTPANEIAALVRDEAKAGDLKAKGVRIVTGDYDNYGSLVEAFKGVDKLLFVSGSDVVNRIKQHENVVKAAKEAGVGHVVYTSFIRKNETETSPIALVAQSHLFTENALKESGITYTILRNNIYADILPMFLGPNVTETGVFFPAGDTPVAFTLRSDMAEATANVLTGTGHENQDYRISNTETVTFHDIARFIGEAAGKELGYVSPESAVYKQVLSGAGLPEEVVAISVGFAEAFKQGEFDSTETDLDTLLGRKPGSVKDYLTAIYSAK